MERQVTLNDSQLKELISFYSEKRKSLIDKLQSINKEIQDVDKLLSPFNDALSSPTVEVEKNDIFTHINNSVYNPKDSLSKKCVWALKQVNKPLSVKDIMSTIVSIEPYIFKGDKRKLRTSISATLGIKSKKGVTYYRESNSEDIFEYGILEWK